MPGGGAACPPAAKSGGKRKARRPTVRAMRRAKEFHEGATAGVEAGVANPM